MESINYTESIARVEEIIKKISSEGADMESLTSDVKEATKLIAACRKQLLKSEEELAKILEEGKGQTE